MQIPSILLKMYSHDYKFSQYQTFYPHICIKFFFLTLFQHYSFNSFICIKLITPTFTPTNYSPHVFVGKLCLYVLYSTSFTKQN